MYTSNTFKISKLLKLRHFKLNHGETVALTHVIPVFPHI